MNEQKPDPSYTDGLADIVRKEREVIVRKFGIMHRGIRDYILPLYRQTRGAVRKINTVYHNLIAMPGYTGAVPDPAYVPPTPVSPWAGLNTETRRIYRGNGLE